MHIQEGTNRTLTTCTKMTEEVDRRHGVNGNSSSKAVTEDAPVHNSTLNASGGRLKFFKDGKFILELVGGMARAGGGAGWVSVPRKTFWPPAAAPATPPAAPPPTSLSVSDDNSSVQSSPWQRDHCWKQPAPRKNHGKELAMYYCRPSTLHCAVIAAASRSKRRRPHDPARHDPPAEPRRNGVAERAEDAVDGAPPRDDDREKYYHMKLKKPYQYRKLRVYKKTRSSLRPKELERTIRKLHERLPAPPPPPINAKLASCRQEHAMVSPRKRILRELERVSLEDAGGKRRARTVPALSTASYPPSPGPSHAAAPRALPAEPPPPPRRDVPPKHSPYSIQSLLSMPDESTPRRSPVPHSAAHKADFPLKSELFPVKSEMFPVKSESYVLKSESYVLKSEQYPLKSESPSGGGSSPAPSPSPEAWRGRAGVRWPAPYRGREEWYYPPYPYMAHVYRAPPAPLWMHYGAPPAPSPWAPLPLPLLTDHIPKDEPTSDLPLNLSKH